MSAKQCSIIDEVYDALSSSIHLDKMTNNLLKTFVERLNIKSASFYIVKNDSYKKFNSIGETFFDNYNIDDISQEKFVVINYKNKELVLYKVKNILLELVITDNVNLGLLEKVFEKLKSKIYNSINNCLEVQDLKNELNLKKEQNKLKDKKVFEHLKMSQMGELIGNIAYQWIKPLSVISTAVSGMKIKKELSILEDKDFFKYTQSIYENSEYLSNTIDEFRDYIEFSHKQREVIVQERLKVAISLVESSFLVHGIKINEGFIEKQKISFKLIYGELLQVIISVLNNAKDALLSNEIKNKWIKYELKREGTFFQITIEDNAGGIDNSIMDKIFEAEFTTKDNRYGNGIGLYAGYDIIVNRLGGNFYAKNTENGAKFYIELPLNIEYII